LYFHSNSVVGHLKEFGTPKKCEENRWFIGCWIYVLHTVLPWETGDEDSTPVRGVPYEPVGRLRPALRIEAIANTIPEPRLSRDTGLQGDLPL